MPKETGHHGGHGPVIPPAEQFNKVYGELRAQLLSRHFAIGRYFRADHLCFFNELGVVQQTNGPADNRQVLQNDVIHDCIWSNVLNGVGTNVFQPVLYKNAANLLEQSPEGQLFDRWQVGDHSRTNPLMYSGQLMVCLAVEVSLGIPGSLDILSRLLSTTRSLFKSPGGPPYNGYILRWDAVTTDHWTTVPTANNPTASGDANGSSKEEQQQWMLGQCCDFFPITDPSAPDGYLYSTPLDDPRYTAYLTSSDFSALSAKQQQKYHAARLISLYQNRYWEPSQDELTGYLAGLSFVFTVVSDPATKAEAASQAALVGGWLSPNGYLLVRPNGGFTAQGGSDIGPALEFPLGRIFSRLTGSSFAAKGGFVSALQNSGLWPAFSAGWAAATAGGVVAAAVLTYFGAYFLGLLGALLAGFVGLTGITIVAARAMLLALNSESFDVFAWPGSKPNGVPSSNGEQSAFITAYFFSVFPSLPRFILWLRGSTLATQLDAAAAALGITLKIGGYAGNFPPFLGLSAFGDPIPTVRTEYLRWFNSNGGSSPAPSSFPPPGVGDDGQSDFPNNADPFATAVAVLLGAGASTQTKLVALLRDLTAEFASSSRAQQLAVFDDNALNPNANAVPYFSSLVGSSATTSQLVNEPVRPALNYLAAVALGWFFSTLPTTNKSSLPEDFPSPPPAGSILPPATIPGEVVTQSLGFPTSFQVIPLAGLPPLPNPIPDQVDLFAADAPGKPAKPPAPSAQVTWILSTKQSHSGGWFGGSGTDTPNAGVTLSTPGGVILGVKLFLVDKHGVPLGGVPTSVALGRASQTAGVPPWPSPKATMGVWPFGGAWARILSIGSTFTDMSVTVQWGYSTGWACRYQIAYLVQAPAPPRHRVASRDLSYMIPLLCS
jgi:hypothetical protein